VGECRSRQSCIIIPMGIEYHQRVNHPLIFESHYGGSRLEKSAGNGHFTMVSHGIRFHVCLYDREMRYPSGAVGKLHDRRPSESWVTRTVTPDGGNIRFTGQLLVH
jgi:hypothetical protein